MESLTAGGISLRQKSRLLPHASGASPTFTVMSVTTAMNRPSTTIKSAIMLKRKDQAQFCTSPLLYFPERPKDWPKQKTK